jgi:F-type H+-transporting ATPase subunit alpha
VTIFALQKGYYDKADIKKVTATAVSIREFFKARQDALLTEIRTKAALDKDIEAKIVAALDAWKSTAA